MKTERFFIDTEFIEDGRVIELLSIAIVSEDDREFYAENADADLSLANDWVKNNVLPHLDGRGAPWFLPHKQIGPAVIDFISASNKTRPEIWAYYADYDWVAICQLFGRMIDLPEHWPMFCMDIKQLAISLGDPLLPLQVEAEHNALSDARWNRTAYDFLIKKKTQRSLS